MKKPTEPLDPGGTHWLISSGALVLLMQIGFAMFESGFVRSHNVVATYAKNTLDLIISMTLSVLWGFGLAYSLVLDDPHPLLWSTEVEAGARFFFFVSFQATAATIVSGAMAERTSILACVLPSRPPRAVAGRRAPGRPGPATDGGTRAALSGGHRPDLRHRVCCRLLFFLVFFI